MVFPSQGPPIVIYDSVDAFLVWPNPANPDSVTCSVSKTPCSSFLSFIVDFEICYVGNGLLVHVFYNGLLH